MKQNPSWEADSRSDCWISRHSWNPKVHYHIHKSSLWILSYASSIHFTSSLTPYFQIYFNIILPSTPRPLKWFLPFRFPDWILYVFLISCVGVAWPNHLVLLDLVTNIQWRVSTSFYAIFSTLLLLPWRRYIFCSQTPSICVSPIARDQLSHKKA
jgi:hypothetical protein